MKPLQLVGRFLLNLIRTNQRETLPGEVIMEVEKTSGILGLNLNDIVKTLIMTVLGSVISDLYASYVAGNFIIDWAAIKHGAIVAGLGYLVKQLGTPSQRILKLLIVGLLFSVPTFGQLNSVFKAAESVNADSVTVRSLLRTDSIAGRETGYLYFNNQSNKWRVGWWSTGQPIQWKDLVPAGTSTVTASNGLTKTGNDIKWGGPLTQNTSITGPHDIDINIGGTILSQATDTEFITSNDFAIAAGGVFRINNLTGTGTRMLTVTSGGVVGAQTIPSGNLSGTLTTPRIPYATGSTTLSDVANMIWDTSTDRQLISNDAGTQTTSTFGGQVTLSEPSANDDVTLSIGNGGDPSIAIKKNSSTTTEVLDGDINFIGYASGTNSINSAGNILINSTGGKDVKLSSTATGGTTTLEANSNILSSSANLDIFADLFRFDGNSGNQVALNTGGTIANINLNSGTGGVNSITSSDALLISTATFNNDLTINTGTGSINVLSEQYTITTNDVQTYTAGGAGLQFIASDVAGNIFFDASSGGGITLTANNGIGITSSNGVGDITLQGGDDIILSGTNNIFLQGTTVTMQKGATGPYNIYFGVQQSSTIDFSSRASLGNETVTVSVTGASTGDGCLVSAPVDSGATFRCRVSAINSVNVTYINSTSGTLDPASGSYVITVTKN